MMRRREVLSAVGAAIGASLVSGCGGDARCDTPQAPAWKYVPLSPPAVAAEAYRIMPEGGCMYGLFKAVLSAWSKETGQALDTFPFHMFRYGEGGIGGFGSICGTLNAGAALIGLFEHDKPRRTQLIAELFQWYEATALPDYQPSGDEKDKSAKSTAGSVLCHISVAHWCKVSGAAPLSKEMGRRCRCLTADVAAKTVELLNRNAADPARDADPKLETPQEPPVALGKMQCAACHDEANKHK